MSLSEAEIQVLATLRKAELEGFSSDRGSLEGRGGRYWIFLEDWSGVYGGLAEQGLIEGDDDGYRLTGAGRPLADAYHRERPDHYWYYYQRFYTAAHASAAHSRLCERVYGEDLCQEGQMDMAELRAMLDCLDLQPGDAVLDLGCGAGVISEYISDRTGATVTGIDYATTAIAAATARTEDKRSRLMFRQGDLSALNLPANSVDAATRVRHLTDAGDLDSGVSNPIHKRLGGTLTTADEKAAGTDQTHGVDMAQAAYLLGFRKDRNPVHCHPDPMSTGNTQFQQCRSQTALGNVMHGTHALELPGDFGFLQNTDGRKKLSACFDLGFGHSQGR